MLFTSRNALICPLTEPWLLQILCKEAYAFFLSFFRHQQLSDPYKQLSAFSVRSISMDLKGENITSVKFQQLCKLLLELKLNCPLLFVYASETDVVLKFLGCTSTRRLILNSANTSFNEILLHEDIQNLNQLQFTTTAKYELPERGLLRHFKRKSLLEFNFKEHQIDDGIEMLKRILMEVSTSASVGKLRCLKFSFPTDFDPSQLAKTLYLALRQPQTTNLYLKHKELFLNELPSKFLIMESSAYVYHRRFRHITNFQMISLSFHTKSVNNLRRVFKLKTNRDVDDDMLHHIMENAKRK